MAHFARLRPSGFWTLNSVIDPAELETLDADHYKSGNLDDGGTWNPSSAIVLGGQGLEINSAPLVMTGADLRGTVTNTVELTISGIGARVTAGAYFKIGTFSTLYLNNSSTLDAQSGSTVTIDAGASLGVSGTATVNSGGNLNVASGGNATVQSGAHLYVASGGNATVQSGGTFSISGEADVLSGGTLFVSSGGAFNMDASATATLAGTMTLSGKIQKSGSGVITNRIVKPTADADHTYAYADGEHFYVPATLSTGSAWNYTLKSTSPTPPTGASMRFTRTGAVDAHSVQFKREDATIIGILPATDASWLEFEFDGTNWVVSAWGGNASLT